MGALFFQELSMVISVAGNVVRLNVGLHVGPSTAVSKKLTHHKEFG